MPRRPFNSATISIIAPAVMLSYSEGSSLERKGPVAIEAALKHHLDPSEYLTMTSQGIVNIPTSSPLPLCASSVLLRSHHDRLPLARTRRRRLEVADAYIPRVFQLELIRDFLRFLARHTGGDRQVPP